MVDLDKLTVDAQEDGIERFVVGAVIIGPYQRVLILKRPTSDFMGGIWELLEETGIVINNIDTYLGHFDYRSGSGKHTRQFNFVTSINDQADIELTEHEAYQWADLSDLDQLGITDSVREILLKLKQ